ncbi:PD-(D/E)XK nuclease-like domain-containing protein [Bradyrhizobium sp. Leo170]|uniref:PD-(D/E)XK nuclease-like domain-containing protein n=1 Tax=Bradyrhizobium sp. Leo170 TaxID=1571199 RepID=UPI00102E9804|nr:PD-(D/E)XK nuclease-like domain-containing protein [Bradyrhizobium sp. Leo170]TAI61091.1 hypothetical protein CWO89_36990 [Bradyrhizobium sp. Leo170]
MQSIPWDGKTIIEPGIYRGIPLTDYHRFDLCSEVSVSSTMLRGIIGESPRHAWEKSRLNPDHVDDEEQSEAMALGRFLHAAVAAEPFESDCVFRPATIAGHPYNGNRKEWREWKAEQIRNRKTIITPEMASHAKGMIVALGSFPLVQAGMLGGAPERSLIWKDDRGFWKKARPDEIPNASGDYAEIKTTHPPVLYRNLQRTMADRGYYQQAAMVIEGARALGLPVQSFTVLFVENRPPYCVRACTLKDEDIARGDQLNQLAYSMFWQCYQGGVWPGPGDDRADAEYIDAPDWWRKSVDDRVKFFLREAA